MSISATYTPNQQSVVSVGYLLDNVARVREYLTMLNEDIPEYKGGFDIPNMSDIEVLDEYLHVRMVERIIE